MTLSEIRGEKSLDVLANMIEPATEILTDPKIKEMTGQKDTKILSIIKVMIKNHKQAVLELLAAVDGVDVDDVDELTEYVNNVNLFTLPKKLMEMLQDENLKVILPLLGQKKDSESSGSVMENIGENEQ